MQNVGAVDHEALPSNNRKNIGVHVHFPPFVFHANRAVFVLEDRPIRTRGGELEQNKNNNTNEERKKIAHAFFFFGGGRKKKRSFVK